MSARTQWIAILGGFLVLVLVAVVLGAIVGAATQQSSEDAEQASSSESATEESTPEEEPTREEVAEETSESFEEQEERKKPIRPEPRTPEERVRANVEDMPMFAKVESGDPKRVWVNFYNDNGCLDVVVKHRNSGGVPFGIVTQADDIEIEMWLIYTAIHADRRTHEAVCDVSAQAYGDITDDYGQVTEEKLYETSLSRDAAARVNWSNADSVNYDQIWQVDYVHPQLESERAQDSAGQVLDCLQDSGLGDLDWLECP